MRSLLERRQALGLTQEAIAHKLRLPSETWQRWERRPKLREPLQHERPYPKWLDELLTGLELKTARYDTSQTDV